MTEKEKEVIETPATPNPRIPDTVSVYTKKEAQEVQGEEFNQDEWETTYRINQVCPDILSSIPHRVFMLAFRDDVTPTDSLCCAMIDAAAAYRQFMIANGVDVKAIEDAAMGEGALAEIRS